VDGSPARLVRIDVLEQPSRADAHQALPAVLAELQSPLMTRNVDLDIGDIAFTIPQGEVMLFARANLVVIMARVGPSHVDIPSLARSLDQSMIEAVRFSRRTDAAAPQASLTVIREQDAVRKLDVSVGPEMRRSGVPMIKVFAPPGHLYEEDNRLCYRPAGDETDGFVHVYLRPPARVGQPAPWIALQAHA
jgi:hypothetical protein